MMKSFRALATLALVAVTLAACVKVPAQKIDIQKAISTRVAAGAEYLRQNKPSEARRHFVHALSLNPESPVANNAMALLYSYERDQEMAEEYYQRALDADSDFAPALNNYGVLLYSQGRYEEAADKFRRAIQDTYYEERASAFSNLGLCYEELGKLEKATNMFARALRLRPGMRTPSLGLARVYYRQDQYRMGWGYFEQYRQRTQLDAESLWLGIRLAAALNRRNDLASFELALQNLYPRSDEYRLWQQWKHSQETR